MNSFKSINSKIAEKLINECKDLIIIDVRRFNEYKTGKIPNAINIPIEELEWEIEDLKENINKPILIYCKVGNKSALAWLSGTFSVLSLFLNIYTKEYKIQDEINQHRNAANALWDIRESYISLLTDYDILENDDIRHQRDVLCKKVSEVNNNYPATDSKSYRAAQKALKKDEEQTFKEGEIDSILPNRIG